MRAACAIAVVPFAILLAAQSRPAAQAPSDAPYVVRGRQTEIRQRAYHERIDRAYQVLSDAIRQAAPDLLPTLAPPPPEMYGYQILPKMAENAVPPPPGTKSQVMSYSWRWSDTLLERELKKIEQLESELAQIPRTAAGRAAFEKLAADYRQIVTSRGTIDADVQYNWLWQARIHESRPTFDHLQTVQQHVLEREAIETALASHDETHLRAAAVRSAGLSGLRTTNDSDPSSDLDSIRAVLAARVRAIDGEIAAANGWAARRDFVRIERPADRQWLVTVPVYTDIADTEFVDAFRRGVEAAWHVRRERDGGTDDYSVRVIVKTMTPEQLYCGRSGPAANRAPEPCVPPAAGAAIDVDTHVARFPSDGGVLTTGAKALRFVGNSGIVLAPGSMTPHVLAHEFGHVLGFPDAYYRGYRDEGADGFVVTELGDLSDIMGAPGVGPVRPRHYEALISAKAGESLNRSLALYRQQRYQESLAAARDALAIKPDYAEAYNNVAAAYAGLANWDEAIRAAEEAIRLKPDFQLAKNNLAWAKDEKDKADPSKRPK